MIMSAAGALLIRLQDGPLDLEFAKERLEKELSTKEQQIEIGKAQLLWPEIAGPLLIGLDSVRIIDRQRPVLAVAQVAMGLSGRHLIKGEIRPDRLIIQRPEIKLYDDEGDLNAFWKTTQNNPILKKEKTQDKDKKNLSQNVPTKEQFPAFLKLQKALQTVVNKAAKKEVVSSKDLRDKISQTLFDLTDLENKEFEMLSALEIIQIQDAVLYGAKLEDGALAAINLRLVKNKDGLIGDLTLATPKYQDKNGFIRTDLTYRRAQKDLTFTGSIENIHSNHLKPFVKNYPEITKQDVFLNGNLQAALNEELRISLASLDLTLPEGKVRIDDLYKEPLAFKDISLKATFNRPKDSFIIENLSGVVGGVPFKMQSDATLKKNYITAPLNIFVASASMDQISTLLPKKFHKENFGVWLTQRLKNGTLSDINFDTKLVIKKDSKTKKRSIKENETKMSFAAQGLTIKYHDTLMPVLDADATVTYENDTLNVLSKKGRIGDINASNVEVKLTALTKRGSGAADISIKARGPLKTALRYVADEPIKAAGNLGFDVNKVQGDIDFNINIKFPTIKDLPSEQVKVVLDSTVNNLRLPNIVKGQNLTGGPYNLKFGDGKISMAGSGKLSGRDITVDWMQYLDTQGKDYESRVTAKITADKELRNIFGVGLEDYISGNTPLDVTYIDRGVKAQINVKADLTPAQLKIDNFNYLKSAGQVQNSQENNQENNLGQVIHLYLQAPKMSGENNISFNNAKLYLELDKQSTPTHIEMDAVVGSGAMAVRFQPDGSGKKFFTMEAADAGATLKAFGLYDKIKGGTLSIQSKAKSGANIKDLTGEARLMNFSVRNAPALAKLLGAMSLPGVEDLLNNDGVVFEKLVSDFEWRFRDNGNILVVRNGRTSGNSLGLTFEGVTNMGDSTIDIAGTIIPLSGVNKVLGQIPVLGQILSYPFLRLAFFVKFYLKMI